MLIFNEFKFSNYNYIFLYYILILIKVSFAGEFIDIKRLSISDNYFIVLDTGLYLYDFNNADFAVIHEFKENEFKSSNNMINITELNNMNRAYIFCLVNENLFLFDEYTYNVLNYKINEIIPYQGYYYNIMPYKFECNNISFIISFNNDTDNLLFYFYNFNLNEGINKPKEILFNDMNIQDKKIRCQINSNSTFIICFYYSIINETKIFASTIFRIKNMNLFTQKKYTKIIDNFIKEIKLAISYDDNYFVCYLKNTTPICLINDYLYDFNEINCVHGQKWSTEYKVLYFKETDDFMLVSRVHLTTTIYNNYNNTVTKCNKNIIFSDQKKVNSIIYINGEYQVINFTNFENYNESIDISILENNKHSKYIDEAKNLVNNTDNKEELIKSLNEFIENGINLDYIDNNEELIILKDEITIAFTSTSIQKINENSNSSTINLGKCEKELKNVYNISEESNLYMLKIDTKQIGKNYPKIEYEVFYPLENGKIEILNLSFCSGIDIELSIPVIINDTIDKYNPKANYYNDICSKATSESNTDIPLCDRRDEFISNNMSLCEDNCELTGYDYNYKKAKCSCNVKTTLSLDNVESDNKNILKNFIDIKKITNIEIVKCYKIVFNINNLKNNYGFFIIFFIFIMYFICIIIFYCISLKILIDEIIKIICIINSKEYQITKSKETYSSFINTQSKRNTLHTKSKIESFTKIIKKEKNLISKKNKRKTNNKNNSKIIKNTKKIKERKSKFNDVLEYTDSELDSLPYQIALKKDKRTYCQFYWSLLKKKQSILFSFCPNKDYNSQIIKLFLFFFIIVQI